jgi:ribonucleotide monophosphatase NagD (HAD superfamily)
MDQQGGRVAASFLMDMDGVLVHEDHPIPGADRFVKALQADGIPFLVLTGISTRADAERFAYRPTRIVESVADLEVDIGAGGLG